MLLDNMDHQQEMSEFQSIIDDEEAGNKQIALFFIDSKYEEDINIDMIHEHSEYMADPEFYYQMHKQIDDIWAVFTQEESETMTDDEWQNLMLSN